MTKGRRLRRWAGRLCSARTMEQLIDPVIADLQHEYEQANAAQQTLRRTAVLLRGYGAFWRVLTVDIPATWLRRSIGELRASHHDLFVRAVVPAAIAMVAANVSLVVVPAQNINQRGLVGAWLLILLLPQSIPFSIPLSLFTGIVFGLRYRPLTTRVRRAVVVVGLAGTLLSAATIVWAVPVANQAFRTTIARRVILKGPSELSSRELRARGLALRDQGHLAKAGDLLLSFHARWALAGSAAVFAVFGLGVAALRLGRVATLLIAATAFVMYVNYFFELSQSRLSSVFSHEGVAFTFAWLPNLLMMLTGLVFLTQRDDERVPTGA